MRRVHQRLSSGHYDVENNRHGATVPIYFADKIFQLRLACHHSIRRSGRGSLYGRRQWKHLGVFVSIDKMPFHCIKVS
jgi:hypothetical protein